MKLKKLEAYGFKSFADKLEMDFGEGITAIVGPNGCGKSNVSDAFRWVLGEQSAKQLRGKGMQDVIFGGTENRKSMSYCEVSLFFDNSERFFPLEFDEVCITRKLYKSGESEYLLNRKPVRLRDLLDLLRDAGLGNEGYTVVGQGRMDAILSAKPENRRAIFEEALGVSKYRARKGDTKRRLERTNINMDRLRDVMEVLERQMRPLEKQAEDAKTFLTLRDQLRYHEINSYLYNYDNANESKQRFANKIAALSEEIAAAEKRYTESGERCESIFAKISETDKLIASLNEQAAAMRVELERKTGEHNLRLEKIKAFETALNSALEEEERAKQTAGNALFEKKRSEELADREKAEAVRLTEEIDALSAENVRINSEIALRREKMDKAGEGAADMIDEIISLRSRKASLIAEKASVSERTEKVCGEIDRLVRKLDSLSETEKEELLLFDALRNETDILKEESSELARKNQEIIERIVRLTEAASQARDVEIKARIRTETLSASANGFENYSDSVRRLLSDAEKQPELNGRILGTAASVMQVDEKYEKAVSAALGGSAQNVITRNEEDAGRVIEYLRTRKAGRVTFMPLSSVKINRFGKPEALAEKGAIAVACDIVRYEERFRPIVLNLLGSVLIADTMENAVAISRRFGSAFRIVTLTGELFSTQGTITGGERRSGEINALSVGRLLKESRAKLASAEKERAAAENALASAQAEKDILSDKISQSDLRLKEKEVALAALSERMSGSSVISENERTLLSRLNEEKKNALSRMDRIDAEIGLIDKKTEEFSRVKEDADVSASDERKAYEALSAQKESIAENIAAKRVELAKTQGNESLLLSKVRSLEDTISQAEKTAEEKRVAADNLRNTIEDAEKQLYRESLDDNGFESLAALNETIRIKTSLKEQLSSEFASRDKEKSVIYNDIMRFTQAKNREEFNLEKIDSDLQSMQEKIYEDYGLSYSAALRFKDENYKAASGKREINRLRNEISALGNVNVNAIESFKALKEEYDEDARQLQDLVKAEEDLNKIMDRLTKEMTGRFNKGFEQISANFSRIFSELFGGGKADMHIEPDPEKEEMDYGIEIQAQPPGKKLQNISLLSGGERALTCIAILFAILRLRPMPFCVLDEIEAPLDDSNAQRVARYIERFAAETQFVVITHKKPTMESAGRLFGITMQEKGVSKIVTVELKDAVRAAGKRTD